MSNYGTIVGPGAVRFERLMDGPIERVWDFLTKREHLATWLGDGDIGGVGSKIALKQEGPKVPHPTGATIVGVVTVCEPLRRLGYTWNHLPPGAAEPTIAESYVLIEIEAAEAGRVRLTLSHTNIDPAFTARLSTGWHSFLDILEARKAGVEPPPIQQMFGRHLPKYEEMLRA